MVIAGSSAILVLAFSRKDRSHGGIWWSRWGSVSLPCTVITVFVTWRLGVWLFPPGKELSMEGKTFFREQIRKMGCWSLSEKKAGVLMLVAVGLWSTDFLHHLSPSSHRPWNGACRGLASCWSAPFSQSEDLKQLNYTTNFVASCLEQLGYVLVKTRAIEGLDKHSVCMDELLDNQSLHPRHLYFLDSLRLSLLS